MRAETPVPAKVLAVVRAPFEAAGAETIDPPVIQPLNLLLDLAGEAMRPRLFVVSDEGGREGALRTDFTIPVAREHIARADGPGRYRYEGKAFRVSPPGLAIERDEEFLQIGLEAFGGEADAQADAAIVGVAWRASVAGGRKDLTLKLGDVGLFATFLAAIGVDGGVKDKLVRALARPRALQAELARSQAGPRATATGPLSVNLIRLPQAKAVAILEAHWEAVGLSPVGGRDAAEIVQRLKRRAEAASGPSLTGKQVELINRYLALEGEPRTVLAGALDITRAKGLAAAVKTWEQRLDLLTLEGIAADRVSFATRFARVFGYYDGLLFEVRSAALDESQPVAGGGRYDTLLAQLGGPDEAAVGCMVRPARAWAEGAGR